MHREPGPRARTRTWVLVAALTAVLAALVLVVAGRSRSRVGSRPDELPVMLNTESPFRYPMSLYARRIQGNVTLRVFVDRDGRVRPESTRVQESSGYTSFDSAAVTGSQELRFAPAKQKGEPVAVSILFPVFFRHPEARPLPGDTVLRGEGRGARDEKRRSP